MKNIIKDQRLIADCTQKQLGKAVNISREAIGAIERGTIPSLLTAFRIAEYFDITVDQLFKIENNESIFKED
jgi:putative transcriptional regulator